MREIKGTLSAEGLHLAIAVARFNSAITEKLLAGALDCIEKHEGTLETVDVFWVPGAFELPSLAKKLEQRGTYDAIICLGAVIRGETSHYDFVAGNASSGIAGVGQNGKLPVIFGVLTVDTLEQAFNRSGIKSGNAGYDAALTAIDMVSVYRQIDKL